MSFVGLIELCAVAAVSFAAATALVCSFAYPLIRRRLQRLQPALRARVLVWLAAAPLASGVMLTALAIAPSVLTAVGLLGDHCAERGHAHAHLCVLHPPAWSGHDVPWILFGLVVAVAVGAATTAAREVIDGRRIERGLRAASRPEVGLQAHVVASETPLSLTAGLRQPRIFLSSGLLRALPGPFLDVVIAHERAHVARRDTLRALVASMLAWIHFPWTSRRLLADLLLAHEEACDDRAVQEVGSRLVVARAIVAVERLARRVPAPAAAFMGSSVRARVERLLLDQGDESLGTPGLLGAAIVATLASVLAPVHHLTETFLHLLLGA